ncbi:hypothetical protein [Enterovibrio norvegicus]|uniref:hypothetical protein n=1 Tax=Enterovibrio norvegicus TaxID=188144 RepID=UPI000C822C27|nr:hypothetical protein [Enterovibrio norvegicus]PML78435.1 hypothetical protein BCT69_16525 [Enterovibrio norvegicus]
MSEDTSRYRILFDLNETGYIHSFHIIPLFIVILALFLLKSELRKSGSIRKLPKSSFFICFMPIFPFFISLYSLVSERVYLQSQYDSGDYSIIEGRLGNFVYNNNNDSAIFDVSGVEFKVGYGASHSYSTIKYHAYLLKKEPIVRVRYNNTLQIIKLEIKSEVI